MQPTDNNDYLEMYQIVLFVEHEIYPPGWDENRTESIKQYKGKIAASFSHINPDELPSLYQETGREYGNTIWKVIDTYKIKSLITEDGLREILAYYPWSLKELLEYQWMDSVANQYNCYVENGMIDKTIIELLHQGNLLLQEVLSLVVIAY